MLEASGGCPEDTPGVSWLRRFTVNKLAMATACSTHAYPIQKYKREIDYQLINTTIRIGT